MTEFILSNEVTIRLGFFFGIFTGVALWELVAPRRALTVSKGVRWVSNLGIVVLNTLVLRAVFAYLAAGLAIGMAAWSASQGWGLLNNFPVPYWLAVLLGAMALDLTIYVQHVMVHAVPALWRLHRMHHSDLDFDVTTGARFHPVEIVLSMGIKLAAITVIGAPPLAVLIFEVLLNGTAMFNHGNIRLPAGLDRWLRMLVVTPDMHRVHHSIHPGETNSNFGFNLPWWDRLFGTYRAQPRDGHVGMTIGIEQFRHPREQWLHRMLIQPFVGGEGDYSLTHRGDGG